MEILLLRNYYSSLTSASIGSYHVTEDISPELSPRYSRTIKGTYVQAKFAPNFISTNEDFGFAYGPTLTGANNIIWFGKNTSPVTFNDYAPIGDYTVDLTRSQTKCNATYNSDTKTYTIISEYTLTNHSDNDLPVNEILIGRGADSGVAYIREVLGENSFTIGAKESVKFEITIKYTIAEPLQ